MFIDRSEFSAHNQVMVFQDAVIVEKKKTLESLDKREVLNAFTLDSPITFSIKDVICELHRLNEEMVPGKTRTSRVLSMVNLADCLFALIVKLVTNGMAFSFKHLIRKISMTPWHRLCNE